MTDSATVSRRSERMALTASRLTSLSRRLTSERGLNGFTIEELCDEVGVSRRTFFNYFPSKEEAVIGVHENDDEAWFSREFLRRGSRGWPAVIEDLVELAVEHALSAGFGSSDHAEFRAAIEREPRLLARFVGAGREREQMLAVVVAEREGVDATDAAARAAVAAFGTILRTAADTVLATPDGGLDDGLAAALTDSLTALRAVLAPTSARKDRP